MVGIVATPIVWVISDSSKNHTRKESIPYSSMVNLGTIVSGGMLTVNTLVPIGTTPQLKLDFQDNQTKEIYEIAR